YEMTLKKWADSGITYNTRLQLQPGYTGPKKHPRALMDKLCEMEPKIIQRLTDWNFQSAQGTTKFWERHCNAISFVKVEASDSIVLTTESTGFQRKDQTCSCCKCKNYPGPSKSPDNHKRSYCSNRFKPKLAGEQPAPWPLPAGIFTTGTEFHPFVFLEHVRKVYERLVEQEIKREDLTKMMH
ncbi:hypothetical protein C8R45DRAFT_829892, partial [Mycena sanguinolenta]